MGIKRFFSFLNTTFPRLFRDSGEPGKYGINVGLYLDLNSPLHNISGRLFGYGLDRELTPEDLQIQEMLRRMSATEVNDLYHKCVGLYIIMSYRKIKPTKYFMIAIDGPAPKAKMNQQRHRRMGGEGPPLDFFDPVMLTPGTPFMNSLDEYIRGPFMREYAHEFAKGVDVIYSSHREPGEGEHKIFDQISKGDNTLYKSVHHKGGRKDQYHVILGEDSDLAVISSMKNRFITWMRSNLFENDKMDLLEIAIHSVIKKPKRADEKKSQEAMLSNWQEYFDSGFKYMNIEDLKRELAKRYIKPYSVSEFAAIVTMVGNDFIPALPEMDAISVRDVSVFTEEQIKQRYYSLHRRSKAGGKFDYKAFKIEFDKLERTWYVKGGGISTNYAKGLLNPLTKKYEIFPYKMNPVLQKRERILMVKGPNNKYYREELEDVGTLIKALNTFQILSMRMNDSSHGSSNFLVESDGYTLNFANLYVYLQEIMVNSKDLLASLIPQRNLIESKGRDPSDLILCSMGKEGGKRNRSKAIVPSAFVNLHRNVSFGIYDSKYADPNLPKRNISEMCRKWLEGMQWTMRYYSEGMRSVDMEWFYPFSEAPTMYDLMNYLRQRINVNVPSRPYIYVEPDFFSVDVDVYAIRGVLGIQENSEHRYMGYLNTSMTGFIEVFNGPKGNLGNITLTDGRSKIVDMASIRLREMSDVKDIVLLGYNGPKTLIVEPKPRKESYKSVREFVYTQEILNAIINKRVPPASIVEMLFSVMPIRVLRLLFSPNIVEAVKSELEDIYPEYIEVSTEGHLYGDSIIINYPSPERVKYVIDNLSQVFSLELGSFNTRAPRYKILHSTKVPKVESLSQVDDSTAYDRPNIEIHTRQKQIFKADEAAKRSGDGNIMGGLGNSLGIVLPQFKQYYEQLHPPKESDPSSKKSKKTVMNIREYYRASQLTSSEKAEALRVSNMTFVIPKSGDAYSNIPWSYPNLFVGLERGFKTFLPSSRYEAASHIRSQLVQEILFLSEFAHRSNTVVYFSDHLEHLPVLTTLFPEHVFEIWTEKTPNWHKEVQDLRNLKLRDRSRFGVREGLNYMQNVNPLMIYSFSENLDKYKLIEHHREQLKYSKMIAPVTALYKFDLAYVDKLASKTEFVEWMSGQIRFPSYSGFNSQFVHLVCDQEDRVAISKDDESVKELYGIVWKAIKTDTVSYPKMRKYLRSEYQNRVHYYNAIIRPYVKFQPELGQDNLPSGFNYSVDQAYEIYALTKYILFRHGTLDPSVNYVKMLLVFVSSISEYFNQSLYMEKVSHNIQRKIYEYGFENIPWNSPKPVELPNISATIKSLPKLDSVVARPIEKISFESIESDHLYDPSIAAESTKNVNFPELRYLMAELEFMVKYKSLSSTIVYIGHGKRENLPILGRLFPKHKFLIFNQEGLPPIEFEAALENVIHANKTFGSLEVGKYANTNVLFMCDIYPEYQTPLTPESEKFIYDANLVQGTWVFEIKPVAALLNFRVPVLLEGNYAFLAGFIWMPTWAPALSMNTYLVIDRRVHLSANSYVSIYYDPVIYRNKMHWFNTFIRQFVTYTNELSVIYNDNQEFDISHEILIWDSYIKDMYINSTITQRKSMVEILMNSISMFLGKLRIPSNTNPNQAGLRANNPNLDEKEFLTLTFLPVV